MALRNWNPAEPTVLGFEWPGMREIAVPLSQDVEYGYTFQANAADVLDIASFLLVEPEVSPLSVSTALVTLYARSDETQYGTPTSTICLVNGGALGGAASLVVGASITACLASSADDAYVAIPNGGADEVRLEFATNSLFTGKRILEVKLRYVATRTTNVEGDTVPTLKLIVNDTAAANIGIVGQIPVDLYAATSSPLRLVSLGECNYAIAGTDVWPYTVTDVNNFDTANLAVRLQATGDATAGSTALHYAALEVVWCEENRVAVGGAMLRQGKDAPTIGPHTVHLRTPAGADNYTKTADAWYTATLVSAKSPGPFVDAVADVVALTMKQTQGASPHTVLIDAFEVSASHEGRVAPRGPTGALLSADDDTRICPLTFRTTAPASTSDAAPYDRIVPGRVYSGSGQTSQEITQWSGGGAVEYPWITFWVRRIGEPTGPLAMSTNAGAATTSITDAQIQAFPEIFDGWRQVIWDWVPNEPTFDNSGTDETILFTCATGDIANRYEILGLNTIRFGGGNSYGATSTYGGSTTNGFNDGTGPIIYYDLAITMHTDAPAVAGFAAAVVTTQAAGETAGSPTPCQVSTFDYVTLSWTITTVAAADFAYYEIQRKDTITTTYQTVAKITTRATVGFLDMEARFAIASTYRMRVVRVDGVYSTWSAEESETPTVGDVTLAQGCGFLYFATNEYYLGPNVAIFSESYESDPTGVFGFVEADDYALNRHYGRFGTQSFHPTERGGVSFERVLLQNGISTTANRADHEFDLLRNLAYGDYPYVCVKDDLGNRWFATVIVPEASVRRPGNIELMTVRIIESTDTAWPADNQLA